MVPSALPRLIQSLMLSLALLLPRLKAEVGTIGGTAATHAGGSDLFCRGSLMRQSGVWITASNLSLLLCPKSEGWSGYRVRRHHKGVIRAPNSVAEKAPAVTTGLLLCPRSRGTNTSGGFCFSVLMKASLRTVAASLRLSLAPLGR